MAPHSSTLAWKIPWMEEPGRLQSMGSLGVGHDWVTSLHFSLSCTGEGNGNPLQCSCLENPRDKGAWRAAVCGVAQSRTQLKRLSSSSSTDNEWMNICFFISIIFLSISWASSLETSATHCIHTLHCFHLLHPLWTLSHHPSHPTPSFLRSNSVVPLRVWVNLACHFILHCLGNCLLS